MVPEVSLVQVQLTFCFHFSAVSKFNLCSKTAQFCAKCTELGRVTRVDVSRQSGYNLLQGSFKARSRQWTGSLGGKKTLGLGTPPQLCIDWYELGLEKQIIDWMFMFERKGSNLGLLKDHSGMSEVLLLENNRYMSIPIWDDSHPHIKNRFLTRELAAGWISRS